MSSFDQGIVAHNDFGLWLVYVMSMLSIFYHPLKGTYVLSKFNVGI